MNIIYNEYNGPNKALINNFINALERYGHILLQLYNFSEEENTKNGSLTPNIGYSRELDIAAWMFQFFPIKSVNFNIKNTKNYDVLISGQPFSIKHKSGNDNSGIIINWSVNNYSNFKKMFKSFDTNLLLVSINRDKLIKLNKTLIIYIIFQNQLNKLYKNYINKRLPIFMKESRGIALSSNFIKDIKNI